MASFNKEKINFVAIDLETATSDRSSICQFGITEVVHGIPQKPKSWLVQPEGNIYDSMNIWIHGITPEDTKNSPSFPDVWKEVLPYLQGKIVVAHNTSFDMYALRDAFDKYKIEYPSFDYFCSLRIARYVIKGCYSYSLDVVLNYLGIYNFHRGTFAPYSFKAHLQNRKHYPNYYQYKDLIKDLEDHPELVDEGNYFYGKSVCFTGKTQYATRKVLLQKVKNIGGIPMDSVTSNTNILVVGQQDYRVVGVDGMSSKQKKALKLLEKGYDIEILSETEFINRI